MSRKLITWIIGIVITLLVVGGIAYLCSELSKYKELYNKELTNVKAYQSENNNLKNQSIAHLMTIDQLISSRDSTDIALKEALKKLNIKPKNVVSAGSVTSNMEKRDSIFLTDTVFVKDLKIDTDYYVTQNYAYDKILPWNFIETKPGKEFLIKECERLINL